MAASSDSIPLASRQAALELLGACLDRGQPLDDALGSLRLTTGYITTDDEVSRAREILTSILTRSAAHA